MIAATLFSGIGAPEASMPSWDWRWCAEIEKFPSAVLAQRFPNSKNLGDVNAKDFVERAKKAGRPDVIVFGSPCQDFSVAGRRVGLDGDRGNLALVALGIITKLRPRWVVFENVPGLLSSYSGGAEAERKIREGDVGGRADCDEDSDFAAFLSLFQQCGYFGFYRITNAQFAGVPQRRRRIFLVGYLGDWRPAAAVFLEPQSLRGDSPPRREAGERVAPTIEARANAGGAGWGTDFMSGGGQASTEEITGAVSSKWAKGTGGPAGDECYNLVAFSGKDYGADALMDQSPTLRAMEFDKSHANGGGQVAVAFQTRVGRNGRGGAEEVVPALNGADAGATSDMRPCVAVFKPSHYTRGKDGAPSGVAPPLGAEPDKGDQDPILMTESSVRRLTPRECERLQGFEDDHTLVDYRGSPAADGSRYKALGNAMNVKEIGWVLNRIDLFEKRFLQKKIPHGKKTGTLEVAT